MAHAAEPRRLQVAVVQAGDVDHLGGAHRGRREAIHRELRGAGGSDQPVVSFRVVALRVPCGVCPLALSRRDARRLAVIGKRPKMKFPRVAAGRLDRPRGDGQGRAIVVRVPGSYRPDRPLRDSPRGDAALRSHELRAPSLHQAMARRERLVPTVRACGASNARPTSNAGHRGPAVRRAIGELAAWRSARDVRFTRRVPASHPNRSSFATEIPTFVIPAPA